MALMPNKIDVLISYMDVCVINTKKGPDGIAEGWGFTEFDYQNNKFAVAPTDIFVPKTKGSPLAPQDNFGSPTIISNNVTFFSSQCTQQSDSICANGHVWETTFSATTRNLESSSSYTPTPVSVGSGSKWQPDGATFNYYPGVGYVLVEQTDIEGDFDIYESGSVTGPWSELATGTMPNCLQEVKAGHGWCYAFEGHPELSSSSEIEVSYFYPDYGPDPSVAHLVAATLPIAG